MTLTLCSTDALLAPLGFTNDGQAIWPVFGSERNVDPTGGGTDPDAEQDDDSDEDDSEETDETSTDGGEWKPPTREEWEKTQAALTKANAEAKKHRLKARELGKATDGADDDRSKKAAEDAEKKFKPVAVRSAAKAALLEAGLNDASDGRLKKLMRMIDMDDVEVDEDGDVVGLDDQVDSIKDDYPELFAKKEEPKKRATKLDAAGRNGSSSNGSKLSTGERIARQVLGRS